MKRKFLLLYFMVALLVFAITATVFARTNQLVKDNSNMAVLGVVDQLIRYTGNREELSYEEFLREGDNLIFTMSAMPAIIDNSNYSNKNDLDTMFYELSKLFRNATKFDLQHTRTLGEIHNLLVRYRYISTSQEGARIVKEIIQKAVFIQPVY